MEWYSPGWNIDGVELTRVEYNAVEFTGIEITVECTGHIILTILTSVTLQCLNCNNVFICNDRMGDKHSNLILVISLNVQNNLYISKNV